MFPIQEAPGQLGPDLGPTTAVESIGLTALIALGFTPAHRRRTATGAPSSAPLPDLTYQ